MRPQPIHPLMATLGPLDPVRLLGVALRGFSKTVGGLLTVAPPKPRVTRRRRR